MLPPGGTLALDLSSMTGWAYGFPADRYPLAFDTWELTSFTKTPNGYLPVGGNDAKGMAFQNELVLGFLSVGKVGITLPSQIVVERPLPPPAQTSTVSAGLAYGLDILVGVEAHRYSVPIMRIDAWTVRQEVFGDALRGIHPKQLKREIVRLVRAKGVPVKDHNAADAVALWLWHKQRTTHRAGPLWDAA